MTNEMLSRICLVILVNAQHDGMDIKNYWFYVSEFQTDFS